ncbi:MAG TPA: hypothetical protein DCP98_01290 [Sphaerochaeta sp.]|nr:hypothetical protein [Sphaerochaeta sp.]
MQVNRKTDGSIGVILNNGTSFNMRSTIFSLQGPVSSADVSDRVSEISDGCVCIDMSWNLPEGDYRIETSFESCALNADNEVFIPSVMYRGNENGKGCFPRLSISNKWSFLESRTSIPACVQLNDGDCVFTAAVLASDPVCSVSWNGKSIIHTIPGFEGPYSYKGKNTLKKSGEPGYLHGSAFRKTFVIGSLKSGDSFEAYRLFMEDFGDARKTCHDTKDSPRPLRYCWNDIEALLLTHLLSLVKKADNTDDEYYLMMGIENGDKQNVYDYTAASFLVKSLEGALVLALSDSEKVKRRASDIVSEVLDRRERILASEFGIIDRSDLYGKLAQGIAKFFFRAEQAPGIFQDCYDIRHDIWGGYLGIGENSKYNRLVNARCNGEAMIAYLGLSDLIPDLKEKIINLVTRVSDFYVRNQLPDGNLGRWWSPEGEPVNTLGTNGAYILSLLICLNRKYPDRKYEEAILRAADYYASVALKGDFFGDTLDADTCDKESGEALLSAMMDLWDAGYRRPEYLQAARRAALFVSTWIFQDNLRFGKDTPMGALGFASQGMTSASIANEHLDFYGFLISYDFLRLYRASGDNLFKTQALNMLNACRQFICSPTEDLGSKRYGWQPEQFNQTDWDYFDVPGRTGFFSIDIAWVTVLSLGAFHKLKKEFPECVSQ